MGANLAKTFATLKPLFKILFYLLATVVLGALLASPFYWGGHWLAEHGTLPALAEVPFRRYFHRSLLVAALVLLWPTIRWLQVRALGLAPNPRRWQDLGAGFASSFLVMAGLGALMLALGIVEMRGHVKGSVFMGAATAAIGASFLEEWLFRGAILGLLVHSMNRYGALFATSALFSIIHFFKPNTPDPATVEWFSGFAMIPAAFANFQEPWLVLGGFVTLFLVGWTLGWSRLKTRSLWMPIGLHAGWVFGLKTFSGVTRRVIKANETMPWFGDTLYVGLASVIAILITLSVVWLILRKREGRA